MKGFLKYKNRTIKSKFVGSPHTCFHLKDFPFAFYIFFLFNFKYHSFHVLKDRLFVFEKTEKDFYNLSLGFKEPLFFFKIRF